MAEYLCYLIFGYLSGSVMYAYILPKLLCHKDIMKLSQDSNPGVANAFIQTGIPMGIIVLICELAKGFVPVYLAGKRQDTYALSYAFILLAPVVGHACSIFLKGEGGKSIAVSFGCLLGLFPDIRPALVLAFFYLLYSLVIVVVSHFHRSVITYTCYSLVAIVLFQDQAIALASVLISAVVIYKHLKMNQKEKIQIRILGLH